MAQRRPGPLMTFLTALLYGVALMAGIANTLALIVGFALGQAFAASLPLALLGWGIVLYIHWRRGWPPFRG